MARRAKPFGWRRGRSPLQEAPNSLSFFLPFFVCVCAPPDKPRAQGRGRSASECPAPSELRSPSGLSGAGQCDFLVMASCQFPKPSESRQLAAYARRRPPGVSDRGLGKSLAPGAGSRGHPTSPGAPRAGPCRPDAAGQQRAACARAVRAGRGAGRLLSLRSSRKLPQRRGEAVSVGAPRLAGHRRGAAERRSAGRTRGPSSEAGRPRLGGPCIRL